MESQDKVTVARVDLWSFLVMRCLGRNEEIDLEAVNRLCRFEREGLLRLGAR